MIYTKPELEWIPFENSDILTTSGDTTPMIPASDDSGLFTD